MGNKSSSSKTTDNTKSSDSQAKGPVVAVGREPSRTLDGLPHYQNAAHNNFQSNASVPHSSHAPHRVGVARASDQYNVGHSSRGQTHYRQDSTLGQRDVRDGSVDVISGDLVSYRVEGGLGQGRGTDTVRKRNNTSFPCGGPAGFGGFVVRDPEMNRDIRNENQSNVGLPSRSHTTQTLGSAFDETKAKKSTANLSSRSHTPYRSNSSAVDPDTTRKTQPSVGIGLSASKDHLNYGLNADSNTMQKNQSSVSGTALRSGTPAYYVLNADHNTMQKNQSSVSGTALPSSTHTHYGLNADPNTMQKNQSSVSGTALLTSTDTHYGLNADPNTMQKNQSRVSGTAVRSSSHTHYGLNADPNTIQKNQSSVSGTAVRSSTHTHYGLNADPNTMQKNQSSVSGTAARSSSHTHYGLNADPNTTQKNQSSVSGTALPSSTHTHYGLNADPNTMQKNQSSVSGTALPTSTPAYYGLNAGPNTMQKNQSSVSGKAVRSSSHTHYGLNADPNTMQKNQSSVSGTALPTSTPAYYGLNADPNTMQKNRSSVSGKAVRSSSHTHYGLNADPNTMQKNQSSVSGTALPTSTPAYYGLNADPNTMQKNQSSVSGTALPSSTHTHYGLNAAPNTMKKNQSSVSGTALPTSTDTHYRLNAGPNTMQKNQSSVSGTALPTSSHAHYKLDSGTLDQGKTSTTQKKTSTVAGKDHASYSLTADRDSAQKSQSNMGTISTGGRVDIVDQSIIGSNVQNKQSSMVTTYRNSAQPNSGVVSDHHLMNTDSIQSTKPNPSGSTYDPISKQVDDTNADDDWADNLPFSMPTKARTPTQQDGDDHNTDNLPFSLQDGAAAPKIEDPVTDKSVPFSLQNGASYRQVSATAADDSSNGLSTASFDEEEDSLDQVNKPVPINCRDNLPFSLQDKVNMDIASSCQASPQANALSNEVAAQGVQNKNYVLGTTSLQRKVHPPLSENECLVSITLPGAVDWQVALDDLKRRLNRFEFKLQDLQNKSRKLHSRNYVICFTNKEDVPSAMDVLKNGKIKAVLCEDILEKSIKDILEQKDQALTSHQNKCNEVMQCIDSMQSDKKGTGKTKFITLDKFEKREAEKGALMQKALELNCQKKEFSVVVNQLIDRILSLKSVKVGWKELDSEIREVKQLMEREKDRLNKALPIYAKRSLITDTVKNNQVSIILGETGSGKSTQVVQYLYDSGLAEKGVIVCAQPRKVAAFSLEKYVCDEMKGSGHVVECSVGARAADKRAKNTKILFTTDYSLLMECIKDQNLTRFSCVIIDEAHERNMNTDLLLGIIKKALPRRPNLRVIITSATINPDLFIKYFGDCPVVKVSGKIFPVDVIWKEQGRSGDYVLEAVDKVVEIHENEEAGDVLVFLTCPAEIEQACTKVQNRIKRNDIKFLPLHGKLQQEEQREVFKPTPKGKRKVVFSTNCAETSLTIPGIKFVVDTGKAKEMKYDPKRNMNSLEVSDISQSSADQRKGRAGRIESGKCYRLYTEDDFKAMEKSSKPEILRVNLGQALLKLMELGIRNPADFDYVESPPIESIKTAMMELEDLGATCDGQLSELGKKMAKVPVDPGLAKFLFEGFNQGVGYEALVLVSVATINGNVFFRMGTEEEKKAADMKKVEFCHLGGDFMTLLDVYRSWQKVDKRDRGRWCFEKSLNAKAMRMADETVKDLKSTLKHELKMTDIKWSSFDKETTDVRLQKTLFSCFMTKLCVYTGHERKGYKTTTGGHFVKIHPSSSINFTGSNPQFIVYEKILKTSQDFLLNVTPIERSWLQESIAEKKLDLDIEEVLAEVLMVVPPISIRCSSILMKRSFEPFRSKLPNLEKSISDSCSNAPIVVEAKRNAGKVDLFVPKNYADKAEELTQKILEEQKTRLREETREYAVIAESSALRVVMGKGLTVQEILLPDMYRSVVVRNFQDIPLSGAHVKEFLCQFGKLIDFNSYGDMHFATYEKPEEASQAVKFCTVEELGYRVEPKKPRQMSQQGRDSSRFNFRIKISWHRREPKGMANVFFQNQPDEMWYEISSTSGLTVGSKLARVRKDKYREKTLFLSNISSNTTKQDIKEAVENVSSVLPSVTIADREILIQYKQRATPANTQAQKTVLEELISKYATPGSFEVKVTEIDVSNKSPFGLAHVDFLNPNEGIKVVQHLSGKRCRGLEMWEVHLEVKPYLNFFDTCLTSVYDLVRDEVQSKINEIANECAETCKRQLRLKEKPAKSKGRIELSVDTTCLEHHLQASKEISKCIQGEKIECPKPSEFLLGKCGRDHLKQIERQNGAFICTDERTMAITVYGTSEQREKARDAVYSLFQALALQGSTVWEVNLKEAGMPRGLMKQLMSKFGLEFEGLLEIEGVNKVDIHFSRQVLKIQSTPDAKSYVRREIEEITKTIAPLQPRTGAEIEEEECPTCFCVIDDETSSYRLAICGHACCMTCIEQQFNAAVFPLCCTHEDCPEMFSLDMVDLLTEKKHAQLHEKVMKMSLKSYVDANQDKARYCPTPDCPMVYPVTTDGKLFRCNVCSTATCSSCHEPYHLGLTCEENEIEKKDPGKALFEKWMNEKPGRRKRCPTCKSPIEKNRGCNHIQCARCKTHMCWPCMKIFSSGSEVYNHQPFCPIRGGE